MKGDILIDLGLLHVSTFLKVLAKNNNGE